MGAVKVTVQTWDVGSPELSLITGGLDVVNGIQSINIWPFDTRASLILDCYSLEHWLPFFARTIRSPAETNKERISLAAFFRPNYSSTRGNEQGTNISGPYQRQAQDEKVAPQIGFHGLAPRSRAHLCFTMVEGSNRRREGGDVSRGFRVPRATDWQGPIGFFVASPFPTWRRTHFPPTLNSCWSSSRAFSLSAVIRAAVGIREPHAVILVATGIQSPCCV